MQNDGFNQSAINTVIVAAVTSNLARALSPGNVALKRGEANLPRRSVVNVTQLATIDKSQLETRVGVLSKFRLAEILDGIAIVLTPTI